MSALWASDPTTERDTARPRSLLRPVSLPRERMARVPFVLVLIALFGLGMAGLLMLNTTLQNQAFQAQTLNRQATGLTYDEAALQRQVDEARAPQELARRASQLGMRPDPYPAFIRLSDGKVVGYPEKVKGNEDETQIVKTPEQLAADAAAAEARRVAAAEAKKKAAAEAAKKKAEAEAKKKAEADAAKKAEAAQKTAAQKKAAETSKTKQSSQSSQQTTKKKQNGRN